MPEMTVQDDFRSAGMVPLAEEVQEPDPVLIDQKSVGEISAAAQDVRKLEEAGVTMPATDATPATDSPEDLRKRDSIILSVLLVVTVACEIILMCQPQVPWLFDKVYFAISLFFQAGMALFFPLGRCSSMARCRSVLLDVVHWAFVVMVFGGAAVLRSSLSVLLLAGLAATAVVARICMGQRCIITAVAQLSSLPDMPGKRVTQVFAGLLGACCIRLYLSMLYGEGFPIDQLLAKLANNRQSVSGSSAMSASSELIF